MLRKTKTTTAGELIPVRSESNLVAFLRSQVADRLSSWRRV
jgi:hypothetical protein